MVTQKAEPKRYGRTGLYRSLGQKANGKFKSKTAHRKMVHSLIKEELKKFSLELEKKGE